MEEYMVVGCGLSGIGAARLLLELDKNVLLYEPQSKLEPGEMRKKVFEGRDDLKVKIDFLRTCTGSITDADLEDVKMCVLSPGVPPDSEFLNPVRERNIEITGEIELAYRYSRGTLAAITGTNGKTTTTSLVGAIAHATKRPAFVVGNIGIPFAMEALKTTDDCIVTAEISSFMLETISSFHPRVSAILNITPDHLNRHKTMERYIEAKENITLNQTMEDTCVLNYDDAVLKGFGEKLRKMKKCRVVFFSGKSVIDDGFYCREDIIYEAKDGVSTELMHVDEMELIGAHNYENVMAAMAIAEALGISKDIYLDVIRHFKAVEHRIEYVDCVNGVKYYNDSKGTNPDAAIQAVKAMKSRTILIGGGYDKGSEFDDWIKAFDGKIKKLILIGATREKIADTCKKLGFLDYEFADSFEEAFEKCVLYSRAGENVLLSPACASWGMFDNYEQRGRVFKELVYRLGGRKE